MNGRLVPSARVACTAPVARAACAARVACVRAVARRRQSGFGLSELIVAAALGLLLTLVAASLLVAANANFLNTGASTRVDDSGRFALAILGQALRQAGYDGDAGTGAHASSGPGSGPGPGPGTDPAAGSAPGPAPSSGSGPDISPPPIVGLDAASLKAAGAGIDNPLPSEVNGSDVLAIHFKGSADGASVNCAGFEEGGEHAWSIFYVAEGADGAAELRCKYRGKTSWASDAIIRGVDSFQLLYGLDTDTPRDDIPNLYVSASAINVMDADLEPVGATEAERAKDLALKSNWRRVATVRVALLLHGEFGSRPPGSQLLRHELFEGYPPIDEAALPVPLQRRVRRVFISTFAVRNR